MPKVPSNSYLDSAPSAPGPRPSGANLLMAAATMAAMGRLEPSTLEREQGKALLKHNMSKGLPSAVSMFRQGDEAVEIAETVRGRYK